MDAGRSIILVVRQALALRKKTQVLREQPGLGLAGTALIVVEAFSHRPVWQHSTEDALANDKCCAAEMLAAGRRAGCWCLTGGFAVFCGTAGGLKRWSWSHQP
jgi:hypothetical protein